MAEGVFIFILFAAITAVTALLFGGWLIVSLIRMIARGFCRVLDLEPMHSKPIATQTTWQVKCGNPQCRAHNGSGAKFCKRCGQTMPQAQRVSVRRAAMW